MDIYLFCLHQDRSVSLRLVEGLSFYGKFAHLRWEKLVKAYERAARKTYKNDPLLKKITFF